MLGLDRLDCQTLAHLLEAVNDLENNHSTVVRTATVDIYGEHRVRLARRGGAWSPLRVTKIERI